MTPTLVGAPWALAARAVATASVNPANNLLFTVKLLTLEIIIFYPKYLRVPSESPADGEPEGGTLLEERNRPANGRDGVQEGRVVRKIGTVGYDGSLQIALKNARIVGPVKAERGVDDGHQNLQLDAGRRA